MKALDGRRRALEVMRRDALLGNAEINNMSMGAQISNNVASACAEIMAQY
jgi:hypothetical protein